MKNKQVNKKSLSPFPHNMAELRRSGSRGYKGCLLPTVTASNWIHARAYYMQPPVIYIQILCTYIFTLCCHKIQYNWHKQNNILYQRINYQ